MAYQITKKSSFFLKVIRELKLYRLKLIPEILIRTIKFDNLRVFYRYKNHSFFTHPLFERVYDNPPLNFTTKKTKSVDYFAVDCSIAVIRQIKRNLSMSEVNEKAEVFEKWCKAKRGASDTAGTANTA